MMPFLSDEYGNAGALYGIGRAAKTAIDKARAQVAALINASPENIIFTSCGSEANSLVLSGVAAYLKSVRKTHILISAVEHESVLRASDSLAKSGFCVEYIPVGADGKVSPSTVKSMLRRDTGLVSVMYINNEIGAVNDIEEIGSICMKNGSLFHTDCVQAAGALAIDVEKIGCDFLTISSHKLHGPKGCGAVYAKTPNTISPIIFGGAAQEFGLRGGTENVAAIVGFGKACELAAQNLRQSSVDIAAVKQRFYLELQRSMENLKTPPILRVNGPSVAAPGKILSLRFQGVDAQTLLLMLDGCDVCASAGSACCSHDIEPSHVLLAMGMGEEDARETVRFSFSRFNTVDEATSAAKIVALAVNSLLNDGRKSV